MNNNPERRVTTRDIAERLEISQAAVSLALRSSREISPALCKRVQETAENMGYRPDPLLSSLSHYRRSKTPMTVGQALAWIKKGIGDNILME